VLKYLANKSKPERAGRSKTYRNKEYKSKFQGDYSLYDEIFPLSTINYSNSIPH